MADQLRSGPNMEGEPFRRAAHTETDHRSAPPEEIAALFEGVGRPIEAGARNPFLLAGDAVWLVHQGQVDVFAVRTENDRPVGPRTHLVRVEAGGALFGL